MMLNDLNEIIFMVLQLVISITIFAFTYYIIPWIKEKVGNEQYERIEKEVTKAVLAIQQMHPDLTGEQKLYMVTERIAKYLSSKNIPLSEQQIRDLIESSVKTMKIQEGKNGHG